jgi:hypothetical protein
VRFKIDCLHAVPTVQMRVAPLDTDNPADLSTIDGLNGWAELVRLYKEQCADASEWSRAFEQCAEGLYEAERLQSGTVAQTPEQEVAGLIEDGIIPEHRRDEFVRAFRQARQAPAVAPRPLDDDGAACQAVGAFLHSLFTAP